MPGEESGLTLKFVTFQSEAAHFTPKNLSCIRLPAGLRDNMPRFISSFLVVGLRLMRTLWNPIRGKQEHHLMHIK